MALLSFVDVGDSNTVSNGHATIKVELQGVNLAIEKPRGAGLVGKIAAELRRRKKRGRVREASETMGKLLASRGGSEEAGSSKSKAGISATYRFGYDGYNGNYYGCSVYSSDWCNNQGAAMSGPDSFAILLCKRA